MKNHGLRLRAALPSDVSILEYWDQQEHVIDSDPDGDWEWEKELVVNPIWRTQWMAELNGERIGFIQIIDPFEEETHYWGEVAPNLKAIDIWIGEEKNLGKGYGTQMMQLAIEKCFSDPKVTKILIDPLATNTKAHRFYERLGFEFVEKRKFDEDDCFVYELKR